MYCFLLDLVYVAVSNAFVFLFETACATQDVP
jgi:hypothetical protein